jgi:dienelactone hydrolase
MKVCELRSGLAAMLAVRVLAVSLVAQPGPAPSTVPFAIRGKVMTLHLYGPSSGEPIIVASGDGGWIHLGPHAAEVLARAGYFVVGLDSRQYLESFTSGSSTLRPADEPGDFRTLAEFASRTTHTRPILVGVSEGAGLSVLAATDPATRPTIRGVVGLGLPDINELGWRWKDAVIYITKGIPNEPTFSVSGIVDRVAPLPLAAIHSTRDEFVPIADIQRIMGRAKEPKRLWVITASNHRFSGAENEFDRRLIEAVDWVKANSGQ